MKFVVEKTRRKPKENRNNMVLYISPLINWST